MGKSQPNFGPLTQAEFDTFSAVEKGGSVEKIAKSRGVMLITIKMQLQSACRKLKIRTADVPGSLAWMAHWQKQLLDPANRPKGVRSQVPGHCPCCGKPWPDAPQVQSDTDLFK